MSETMEGGIKKGELNILLADGSNEPVNVLSLIVSDNMETIKDTYEKLGVKEYVDIKESIVRFCRVAGEEYNALGLEYKWFRKDSWIFEHKEKNDTPKHFYFLVDDPFDTLNLHDPMANINAWASSNLITYLTVIPFVFSYILTIKDENNFKLNKWRTKTNEYTKLFYKETGEKT